MIGVLENAMVAWMQAAGTGVDGDPPALSYAYRTLTSWPKLFDDFMAKQTPQYPACWAAFGGIHKIERMGRARFRCISTVSMVVAAENIRNEQARRQGGSASEPGSYQLATDALQLLGNQKLGLDIDPLEPLSIQAVETSDIPSLRQISIYAVSFETALYYDTLPTVTGALNPFATFHANWDPAPGGHVNPAALPDDADAVATDNIQLPQD